LAGDKLAVVNIPHLPPLPTFVHPAAAALAVLLLLPSVSSGQEAAYPIREAPVLQTSPSLSLPPEFRPDSAAPVTQPPVPVAPSKPSVTVPSGAPNGATEEVILRALAQLGVRYRFGGNHPDTGFDCSGLVGFAFREAIGRQLPRSAADIWSYASARAEDVAKNDLVPGDLVFFNTLRRPYSHVGIYLGDGRFVHAPSSGGVVRIESMEGRYWVGRYNGAKRLL
jgi:cell wall-associated NlpC family hydrolase